MTLIQQTRKRGEDDGINGLYERRFSGSKESRYDRYWHSLISLKQSSGMGVKLRSSMDQGRTHGTSSSSSMTEALYRSEKRVRERYQVTCDPLVPPPPPFHPVESNYRDPHRNVR